MLDHFRIPGPARGVARFFGLLGGIALTWACVAFGVMVFHEGLFFSYRCPPPSKVAKRRIADLESALSQYQIDENGRCPAPGDLIRGRWIISSSLVDPWGTVIAYRCLADDTDIRSAGPDKLFNTDDDVTNLQP